MGYGLWAMDNEHLSVAFLQLTNVYIAYCLLPIAYCLLPIAYCLLPIIF